MATYVNNLRLKEITTGDESGTWGTSTNLNLELIGQALGYGTEGITTNADTHATTIADGAADEGRALFLKYTGTLDSACTITLGPNTVKKVWIIENATSGSQNIIISQGSGANITIAPGKNATIYTDGAGSGAAVLDAFADLELSSTLSVAGTSTLTGDVIIGASPSTEGAVRLTNNTAIVSRNAANSANKSLIYLDGSNVVQIDAGAAGVAMAGTLGVTGVTTHGGNVVSDTDSTDDLGTTGVRWANLYVDDVVATTTVKPGTLVLAAGSITDTSGAITFGNENLVTTGTFGAAATTLSSTLAVGGNLTVSGAGPHAIGAAVVNYAGFYLGASFTSLGASTVAVGTLIGQALTNHSGDTTYSSSVAMNGIQTNMVTGTIADISQLRIDEPGITNTGGGTITNASSLHITGAPTEGAANWAMLVDAGAVSLGGTLAVAGTSAFSSDMVVSASGAHRTITIGDGSSGSYSGLIIRAADTQRAWKIVASQTITQALEFIPGTATGNTTFTTPTMSMEAAGVSVTGTLAVTGNTSFNATYRMAAVGLSEYATNGNGNFPINFRGYNDGTTQFRDFTVYDGKETAILTVDGSAATVALAADLTLAATKKLYLDGGSNTYINEPSADQIDFFTGGGERLKITSTQFQISTDVTLVATNKLYLDGGGNTYIYEQQADSIDFVTGGSLAATFNGAGNASFAGDVILAATKKLYLDGGGNTYIVEESADDLHFVTGGTARLTIAADGKTHVNGGTAAAYPAAGFATFWTTADQYAANFRHDGNATSSLGVNIICGADDAAGTNTAVGIMSGNGTTQGTITFTSGTVSYNAFTAGHDASLPVGETAYAYGTLVEIVEIYYKQEDGQDMERGILYKVQKSQSAYAKNVLGAYSGQYTESVVNDDNLHQIYCLGDGHIICNGENGDIEVGDGICTSSTEGEGMKADQLSMIIGMAQEDTSFSSASETKLVPVQYGLKQFQPWS
jgi:hypothetical protein